MSDLIVIGYPNEETAQNAWEELVKLEHDYLVDLEDAAIIRRDQKGKLRITTPAHHAVAWGSFSGLFWGVLLGLLFLFPLAPVVGVAGGIMGAALGSAEQSTDDPQGVGGSLNAVVEDEVGDPCPLLNLIGARRSFRRDRSRLDNQVGPHPRDHLNGIARVRAHHSADDRQPGEIRREIGPLPAG